MAGMEFHVSFLVDEEHLGPVMAALYRVGDISHLSMTPVSDIEHQISPTGSEKAPEKKNAKGTAKNREIIRRGRGPGGLKLADMILERMAKSDTTASEDMRDIIREHNYSEKGLYSCLDRLLRANRIVRLSPGLYKMNKEKDRAAQ